MLYSASIVKKMSPYKFPVSSQMPYIHCAYWYYKKESFLNLMLPISLLTSVSDRSDYLLLLPLHPVLTTNPLSCCGPIPATLLAYSNLTMWVVIKQVLTSQDLAWATDWHQYPGPHTHFFPPSKCTVCFLHLHTPISIHTRRGSATSEIKFKMLGPYTSINWLHWKAKKKLS